MLKSQISFFANLFAVLLVMAFAIEFAAVLHANVVPGDFACDDTCNQSCDSPITPVGSVPGDACPGVCRTGQGTCGPDCFCIVIVFGVNKECACW
jgi:hypothetical protein